MGFSLGKRDSKVLKVTPDVTVGPRDAPTLLVDAKYRTRLNGKLSVDNSDVYESLAFMRAAGVQRMILLYPRPASHGDPTEPGSTQIFQTIEVGEERIDAMLVECRGVSLTQGFESFSRNLASGVMDAQLLSN
ncbi:Restriction endonuclease OS=Streptomyces fumanus OX=67302 GN=GCM10018772_51100 PE=4 SV=1 [Streptomyces fumanus]